jgi:hypothetical protein
LDTTYSHEPPPNASCSAAWRALAVFNTSTSLPGSGRVRRDVADFGSFSTARPPASTLLLTIDTVFS